MSGITLGKFIANQLPGSQLKEWDMAPKSFDFEVRHTQFETTVDSQVRTWIENFFRQIHSQYRIDKYLTGTVNLDGREYVLCVTNQSALGIIRGTFSTI